MVVQSAKAAMANANAYSTCQSGLCLKYVRTWLEIGSKEASAAKAWAAAKNKHAKDPNPPAGVPVFWTGGSQGYGHIALSVGNGKCRSTDVPGGGKVGTVDIAWITSHWGQKYEGWTEDLNGVTIPYAAKAPTNKGASGKVYVAKLVLGQQNSDSVARLRYRLTNHTQIPAGRKPGNGGGYGAKVKAAVSYWQNEVAHKIAGPKDGKSLSNQQAEVLFGPAYTVVKK